MEKRYLRGGRENMKEEYKVKKGEDYLDWVERLDKKMLKSNFVQEADPELISILINQIPFLTKLYREYRKHLETKS